MEKDSVTVKDTAIVSAYQSDLNELKIDDINVQGEIITAAQKRKKKMFLIYNSHSGKNQIRSKLEDIIDKFCKAGYSIEIYSTQYKFDAKRVVLERGSRFDIIVCCGGDGTLNEVVSGMMLLKKIPILGYIPTGTTCDFAYSHRIPRDILKAADLIVKGRPMKIDLGVVDESQYFTYVAAFGAFTEVTYQTSQDLKAIVGHIAYILEGAKTLTDLKTHHGYVVIDGEKIEHDILVALVSNSTRVAGIKGIMGKGIGLDDGLFEVMIASMPQDLLQVPDVIGNVLQGKESTLVHRYRTNRIEFHMDDPINWVLDGEYGGEKTIAIVENKKKVLRIMKEAEK